MSFGRGTCDKNCFNTSTNSCTPDKAKTTCFELLRDVPKYSTREIFGGDKDHNVLINELFLSVNGLLSYIRDWRGRGGDYYTSNGWLCKIPFFKNSCLLQVQPPYNCFFRNGISVSITKHPYKEAAGNGLWLCQSLLCKKLRLTTLPLPPRH